MQQLWVRWPTRWPLQPLQPLQKTQLQPPFGPSVDWLCHPWFTTTNLSCRFPIFETFATALCGTTGSPRTWIHSGSWLPSYFSVNMQLIFNRLIHFQAKNIENPIENVEVLCVFFAEFGQRNANFFLSRICAHRIRIRMCLKLPQMRRAWCQLKRSL